MLKHLTVDEMVALASPWVNKTKRHTTFLSIPEIAGLLPKVTTAYNAVVAVRPASRSTSPEVVKIEAQLVEVDNRHDPLARCTVRTLEAERERCYAVEVPDAERAARCDEVTTMLFPTGLSIIKASFLAESGNTARVARLLEEKPEVEAFLKGVFTTDKKPLLETVRRWIATGVKLEKLEHEREELLAKQAVPVAKVTIQAARSQWLKVVSAVLSNLELSDASPEAIEAIRGPVLRASERAGKRVAGGKGNEPVLDPADQGGDEQPEGALAEPGATPA